MEDNPLFQRHVMKDRTVIKRISTCIDAAFRELGSSVADALYFYLENNFGLKKSEIPTHIETFSEALHSIFGEGAKLIEKLCIKKLQQEFRIEIVEEEIGLANAVKIIIKYTKMKTSNAKQLAYSET